MLHSVSVESMGMRVGLLNGVKALEASESLDSSLVDTLMGIIRSGR